VNIRIPRWLVAAWDAFGDWANVNVYERGKIELRRIDLVLAIGFFGCVAWYAYHDGVMGALIGGTLYAFLMMAALWMF